MGRSLCSILSGHGTKYHLRHTCQHNRFQQNCQSYCGFSSNSLSDNILSRPVVDSCAFPGNIQLDKFSCVHCRCLSAPFPVPSQSGEFPALPNAHSIKLNHLAGIQRATVRSAVQFIPGLSAVIFSPVMSETDNRDRFSLTIILTCYSKKILEHGHGCSVCPGHSKYSNWYFCKGIICGFGTLIGRSSI